MLTLFILLADLPLKTETFAVTFFPFNTVLECYNVMTYIGRWNKRKK